MFCHRQLAALPALQQAPEPCQRLTPALRGRVFWYNNFFYIYKTIYWVRHSNTVKNQWAFPPRTGLCLCRNRLCGLGAASVWSAVLWSMHDSSPHDVVPSCVCAS